MTPGKLYKLILISFCLLLNSGLALEHRLVRQAGSLESNELKADDHALPEMTETFRLAELDRLSLVTTAPLFYSDRQPLPDEPEITKKASKKEKPDPKKLTLKLMGIVIENDKQFAIIYDSKAKRSETLRPGEGMNNDKTDWTLQAINPRQVVINNQIEQKEEVLELDVFVGSLGKGRESRSKSTKATKTTSAKEKAAERKAKRQKARAAAREKRKAKNKNT